MIPIKTKDEIERMQEGGRRLAKVMRKVLKQVKLGVRLSELDKLAESLIEKQGGKPSFKMVKGYNWATCINVNQGVVHGVPNEYRIKSGDLVSVDVGMFYRGLHTDMARTLRVRGQNSRPTRCRRSYLPDLLRNSKRAGVEAGAAKRKTQNEEFLEAGKRALEKAIEAARSRNRVGHISQAIEEEIRQASFTPIQALTGHGVGRKLHEEPQIPCFFGGKLSGTAGLRPGMTLAIEVIYSQGKPEVVLNDDGWTINTQDGKLAGLFEHTVAVTPEGPLVLTG